MNTKVFYIIAFILLVSSSTIFAQGFTAPSHGKAVVYFVRVSGYGGAVSFEYFHQDKYIGIFKGKNYLRYECDPGKNLFWASSENKEFVTADLIEGGSYIVIVDIIMGAWKARVGLRPITVNDSEVFERAKELILKKAPIVTTSDKIEKMNEKLRPFIAEKLKMYNEVWKNEKGFKHISSEMAIPANAMK